MNLRLATMRGAGVMLLLALAACGGGGEDAPLPASTGLQPTLASIQANVFTPSCAKSGCHAGVGAQAGLSLEPGSSWGSLYMIASSQDLSLTRVIPGNPDGSLLIRKLEGTAMVGGRMPADGPPYLQQVTVNEIRLWIQDGALP